MGNFMIEIKPVKYEVIINGEKQKYIYIESRGKDAWAVCEMGEVLNSSGDFEYESMPSSRTDEFINRTRFKTVEEAVKMIEQFYKI